MKDAKDVVKNRTDCTEREGMFDGYAWVGVLYSGKAAQEDKDPLTSQLAVYWHWSTT